MLGHKYFLQGGKCDVTSIYVRVEMLCYKYFFKVEMLGHK